MQCLVVRNSVSCPACECFIAKVTFYALSGQHFSYALHVQPSSPVTKHGECSRSEPGHVPILAGVVISKLGLVHVSGRRVD
jgi:hypothetical protein